MLSLLFMPDRFFRHATLTGAALLYAAVTRAYATPSHTLHADISQRRRIVSPFSLRRVDVAAF